MRFLVIIFLITLLSACDRANDAAKLYRIGRRIERATNDNELLNGNRDNGKQNEWGKSSLIQVETLQNSEADYSVDLRLPIDTSRSIFMTMSVLPHMIEAYSEKESKMMLNFYLDTTLVKRFLVNYKWISTNKYDYRVIKKYDSPTTYKANAANY